MPKNFVKSDYLFVVYGPRLSGKSVCIIAESESVARRMVLTKDPHFPIEGVYKGRKIDMISKNCHLLKWMQPIAAEVSNG